MLIQDRAILQQIVRWVVILSGITFSVASTAEDTSLQQRISDLEQEVKKLKDAQGQDPAAPLPNSKSKPTDPYLRITSPDGSSSFRIGGLLQIDGRAFESGLRNQPAASSSATVNAADDLLVRRARATLEGTIADDYGFRLTPDFAGNSTTLVDAYINANVGSTLKIYAGKLIPALEIERLQTSSDTRFNELSLASDLVPTRDIGIQIGGSLASNYLNYNIGVFNGAPDGVIANNSSMNANKEMVYRFIIRPLNYWQDTVGDLGIGLAVSDQQFRGGTANPSANTVPSLSTGLATYNSIGQQTIFSYRTDTNETNTVFADGRQHRTIPQASYFYRNWGVVSEYAREVQAIQRNYGAGIANQRAANLVHHAAQTTFVWAISGEPESLKPFRPAKSFKPGQGNWGGWELALRYSQLGFDRDSFDVDGKLVNNTQNFADPTRSVLHAQDTGIALNWYPTTQVRFSLDYDHTTFAWGGGGTATLPKDRPDENVLIGRIQVVF